LIRGGKGRAPRKGMMLPLHATLGRCFFSSLHAPAALYFVPGSPAPGAPVASPTPVVFLHGLLGSSTNFRTIQQATSKHRPTLAFDMRNHGRSPHTRGPCTLDDMAGDIAAALQALSSGVHASPTGYSLVGHSLGGKVAMRLALLHPHLVQSLCVVDIAPTPYDTATEGWKAVQGVVHAAASLDPTRFASRQEVDRALSALVPDPGVRSFVAQNLVPREGGGFTWRLGWECILASMGNFAAWPSHPPARAGLDVHFIRGTRSTYITQAHMGAISATFPGAAVHGVEAGHWVHAENPAGFWGVLAKVLALNTAQG
jgi:esterase